MNVTYSSGFSTWSLFTSPSRIAAKQVLRYEDSADGEAEGIGLVELLSMIELGDDVAGTAVVELVFTIIVGGDVPRSTLGSIEGADVCG
jgi:hypothetical protein